MIIIKDSGILFGIFYKHFEFSIVKYYGMKRPKIELRITI